MSRVAIGLVLALLSTGCNQSRFSQQTVYNEQAHSRPVVAIVPLIDSTKNDISWSMSEELTATIFHRLSQRDKLYLVDIEKIKTNLKKVPTGINPFGPSLAWTKKAFSKDEFVVFMELIEHDEIPLRHQKTASPEEVSAELNMTVRIRVVDLRGEEPKIILQEMVHDSHHIPKQFTQTNFYQVPWGRESYSISPLGLAHAQLSKEIATRLEEYILLSKSK